MKVGGSVGAGGTVTSVGHFDMVGLFLKKRADDVERTPT
jgi:hypothetical protein